MMCILLILIICLNIFCSMLIILLNRIVKISLAFISYFIIHELLNKQTHPTVHYLYLVSYEVTQNDQTFLWPQTSVGEVITSHQLCACLLCGSFKTV